MHLFQDVSEDKSPDCPKNELKGGSEENGMGKYQPTSHEEGTDPLQDNINSTQKRGDQQEGQGSIHR